jgi:perosamine synthetase
MQIPLVRPTIRRRYMHSVLTHLVDEDIGPGKTTRDLVGALCTYLGAAGGVALSSAYAAVSLAVDVVGLGAGDRVVLPALAPLVYLDVLRARGLEVLLADVDPATGTASRESLTALMSRGAKAIFAHHTLGFAMPFDAATEAGIPVVEDVTCSLAPVPTPEEGLLPGLPDLVTLSLAEGGMITAGGGAVLLARKRGLVAALRSAAGNAAHHQQLPNVGAALALAQLQDVDADRARRQEIVLMYRAAVRKSRHETLVETGGGTMPAYAFPVKLRDSLGEARQYARRQGVETRPAYEDACVASSEELLSECPNARKLLLCCLLFPVYPMLSRRNAESVCRVLATLP